MEDKCSFQRLPTTSHLWDVKKIIAMYFGIWSKIKRVSLFVINQNDMGVRFVGKRKYTVEEGDFKVTLWEEPGMVYAMVI